MTPKYKNSSVAVVAVLLLAGVAAAVLAGCSAVGPLHAPDGWVQKRILWRTPLGSSTNQVLAVIYKHQWPPCGEFCPAGAFGGVGGLWIEGLGCYIDWVGPGPTVGGGYIEEREIGTIHTPFHTTVIAFWIFDKNGRLVDVRIFDDVDAL